MEVIQGKSKDKKIVIAQEIAFAKVLAGNNKTLRDRALKKLKKWLTIRGNGKWEFTEEEFLRIWTGLFYCMWMSDKFLIQEELAECISELIHCFKKNSDTALLFIKCFHKRILMEWEGLDQYRIDKFNMLVRRFLRQTFIYCKEKDWDQLILNKLMGVFYNEVLYRDSSLGYVLHFISIYAEELAKVSNGKLDSKTLLILIEPLVRVVARSKDRRIRRETEEFFNYLMRQTDVGIEFEEKFHAWKEQGYPGEGPHCMMTTGIVDGKLMPLEKENDILEEEEDLESQPLDPRAGSVHVFLPQIPIDINALVNLFKKYQNGRYTNAKGRKLLKSLIQKFEAIKKGRFPVKIKKDLVLFEKTKKKKRTVKNAKELMKFTDHLDEAPITTKEFKDMIMELEGPEENDPENEKSGMVNGIDESFSFDEGEDKDNDDDDNCNCDGIGATELDLKEHNIRCEKPNVNVKNKNNKEAFRKNNEDDYVSNLKEKVDAIGKKNSVIQNRLNNKIINPNDNREIRKKKQKLRKTVQNGKSVKKILNSENILTTPMEKCVVGVAGETPDGSKKNIHKTKPALKTGIKRKILTSWQIQELNTNSPDYHKIETPKIIKAGIKPKILTSWQVQELGTHSPEYYKIETPKVIRIEKKIDETSFFKGNKFENLKKKKENSEENANGGEETEEKSKFVPVFWGKAKAKVNKRSGSKGKVFMNPFFAKIDEESKNPNRKISFALDRNMAQENEQYLEEVKNSPRVPFDGSKKPTQSALKSGLAPSPVNPFYHFKKIKF